MQVDHMQEQLGNVSTEMGTPRKNQRQCWKSKTPERKRCIHLLWAHQEIGCGPVKNRWTLQVSQLKLLKLIFQEKKYKQQRKKKVQGVWGNYKCNSHVIGLPGEERGKAKEEIFEVLITENFPKLIKNL